MNSRYHQSYQNNETLIKITTFLARGWGKLAAGAAIGHLIFAMFIPIDKIIFRLFVGAGTENLGCCVMIAIGGLIGAATICPEVWNETQLK